MISNKDKEEWRKEFEQLLACTGGSFQSPLTKQNSKPLSTEMLRRWVGALVSLEDGISLERENRSFLCRTLEQEILQPARFLLQHLGQEERDKDCTTEEGSITASTTTQRKRKRRAVTQQTLSGVTKRASVVGNDPWSFLRRNLATKPMRKHHGFWSVHCDDKTTIDSVFSPHPANGTDTNHMAMNAMAATAHVAQAACGTAVHIGAHRILTAAHVVEERNNTSLPQLLLLVFPNDRNVGLAECVAKDDASDVAVLQWLEVGTAYPKGGLAELSSRPLATAEPKLGDPLLCIGNPCNIDLESSNQEEMDLQPKVWHASLGHWKGRFVEDPQHTDDALGPISHTCWTYWGHSGAPLFDATGAVVGLHTSWDDDTGMRLGVGRLEMFRVLNSIKCNRSFSSATASVDGIVPALPLSDINVVIVTDVHSWVAGHSVPKNPQTPNVMERTADYGDVLSFVEHFKSYMMNSQPEKDIWFVMNGDWIDGTGLAMNGNAEYLIPILEKMDFDAVTVGNHELYEKSVIQQMLKPAGFIEFLGNRYVSSNVVRAERPDRSIGNPYTILRGRYSNLLVLGFLYEMQDNDDLVVVQTVQKTVESTWFKSVVKDTSDYHAILVLAHMDVRDHLIATIISAIRKLAGPNMPVQFVTGHSHHRDHEKIDDNSMSVEAGRYLDTVGFVSFPSTKYQDVAPDLPTVLPNVTHDNTTAAPTAVPSKFQHVFIDATPTALKHALGMAAEFNLKTTKGEELSLFIDQIRLDLGLTKIVGYACETYYLEKPISAESSIWGFFQREVVPSQATSRDQVVIVDNESWRYDYLYEGDVRLDDVIGISPFNDTFLVIKGVETTALLEFDKTYNDVADPIPHFVLSYADPNASFDTVDVMVAAFQADWIANAIEAFNSKPLEPPVATTVTTTSIWLDYFAKEGYKYCTTKGKGPPKSHYKHKTNPFGESESNDALDVTFGATAIVIVLVLFAAMVHQKAAMSRHENSAKEFIILQAQREYDDLYRDDDELSDDEYGTEGELL